MKDIIKWSEESLNLREDVGQARILPVGLIAELSDADQLEQISFQVVNLFQYVRVQVQHLRIDFEIDINWTNMKY